MSWESYFKIGLPAIPLLYTIIGVGIYWRENFLHLLAPNLAFWGVGIAFYLFTHMYVPEKRNPFYLALCTAVLWLVAAITSHNLAGFINSKFYTGFSSVLRNTDFWFAYIFAGFGFCVPLSLFVSHEKEIVGQVTLEREAN